jgi:hypothetical protein
LAPVSNHHSPSASSGLTPLRNVITSTPIGVPPRARVMAVIAR